VPTITNEHWDLPEAVIATSHTRYKATRAVWLTACCVSW
jgi:hypothetical protein